MGERLYRMLRMKGEGMPHHWNKPMSTTDGMVECKMTKNQIKEAVDALTRDLTEPEEFALT